MTPPVKVSTVGSTSVISTTSTDYVDMTDMSVTFTLNVACTVLYLSSVAVSHSTVGKKINMYCDGDTTIYGFYLCSTAATDGESATLSWFAYQSLAAGTYTRKIKWNTTGGTAYAHHRHLTVLAVPA
jgi:hypothetical protein